MATMTVTDLATELDTDGRTTRKFLRKVTPQEDHPGKGGRWVIERKTLASLKKQFAKFEAEKATPEVDDASTED